ncbi:hypothetical protein BHE74_00055630 [Ensete ventricosum]|nr:hypothetical protein BHE74_00055630 [Ensete ventricosum]RZS23077.1 hypothetical protein BHM03_00055935 [Ensete ventricosum]
MEGNSRALAEGELSAAANGRSGDWRNELHPEARQKVVNVIHEGMTRRLPFSEPEDLNQIRNVAVWFEEKIFSEALNQVHFIRLTSNSVVLSY